MSPQESIEQDWSRRGVSALLSPEAAPERVNACLLMSLLLLLINGPEQWFVRGPIYGIVIASLVLGTLRYRPAVWWFSAAVTSVSVLYYWPTTDNHKYLMVYWLIAIGCVLSARPSRQPEILHFNARWLIVGVMGFATVWKLTSPTYISGAFFEYTFLTDNRFHGFVSLLTGVRIEDLAQNERIVTGLHFSPVLNLEPAELNSSSMVKLLAQLTTWWTVLIEGGCAILFLMPENRGQAVWRHAALLLFAATTYLIAPVAGFGCLLMLLGMSQCLQRDQRIFGLYAAMFIVIEVAAIVSSDLWDVVT